MGSKMGTICPVFWGVDRHYKPSLWWGQYNLIFIDIYAHRKSGRRRLWMIFTSVGISRFSAKNIDYLYAFLNYYNKDYAAT